jgi:hypothetical protein
MQQIELCRLTDAVRTPKGAAKPAGLGDSSFLMATWPEETFWEVAGFEPDKMPTSKALKSELKYL